MLKTSENFKFKIPVPKALALALISLSALNLPTYAQGSTAGVSFGNSVYGSSGTSTLRNPLVPGASFSLPGITPAVGAPPPPGAGLVPLPPNPGMLLSPPSLIPWTNGTAGNPLSLPTNQVVTPANQIDRPSNQISLPVSNASAMPPGAMNAQVKGSIPFGPSTPGADPGMLRPPSFNNGSSGASSGQSQQSAAAVGNVDSNGQINGSAPTSRPVRQDSNDFGLKRSFSGYKATFSGSGAQSTFQQWTPRPSSTTTDFGQSVKEVAVKPAQISYDSPRPSRQGQTNNHSKNFANAQVTNDLYGIPMVNPLKISTDSSGNIQKGVKPLTTIIPPPM